MTPLRQKFIEVLTLKGYSPRTIESYVSVVVRLARHYHAPPDQITDDQLRAYLYQLHTNSTYSPNTLNVIINALRFFYRELFQRSLGQLDFALPRFRKRVRRPQAYGLSEVQQLLEKGFTSPKHRAFFMTLYGCGLRLNEACHLRLEDIDSARMQLRVLQGKGHKDRYVLLPQHLLAELRAYWRVYRPKSWLFPSSHDPEKPMNARTVQIAFKQALQRAGLPHKGGPHSLRHSWASHLIEAGTPLHIIKRLMGHTSITTTAAYLHISTEALEKVRNPLDSMTGSTPRAA